MKKILKTVLVIFVFFIGFILTFGYFRVYRPILRIKTIAVNSQVNAQALIAAIKSSDLGLAKQRLTDIETRLTETKKIASEFSWMSILPIANKYYADSQAGLSAASELLTAAKISIDAISPYSDLLGLKGVDNANQSGKTAQDRINFLVKTIELLKPQMDEIAKHVQASKNLVDQIDPTRYPEYFRGQPIRSQLTQGISLIDQASILLSDARPFLESMPYMLGMTTPRKYLVLFQNDAELRPTGGFLTAYAILKVDNSKVSILANDDIYALDAKFKSNLPAPAVIQKYLPKVPNWYLRDMNLSPDLRVSMNTFYPNYLKTGSSPVDGIITMDTQVLVDILKVIGPVGVSGFGTYSAESDKRCNCPQVFYELELFADVEGPVTWDTVTGEIVIKPQNYGTRKSFIGPMMNSILLNVMAQPKSKMGNLFTTAINLIKEKHLQLYFIDSKVQSAIESFNLAGRVRETSGDYLFVVDTNFAGAKTNAWVTYTAEQDINITKDGKVTKTLTLKYNNPQAFFEDPKTKLRLNGMFRNWLRVYVPKGSKLIEAKGFELGQAVSEDLDKTVFEGFFTLAPLNVKTISFKYEIPGSFNSPYKLLIQKQSGAKNFSYKTTINGKALPEIILSGDTDIVYPF